MTHPAGQRTMYNGPSRRFGAHARIKHDDDGRDTTDAAAHIGLIYRVAERAAPLVRVRDPNELLATAYLCFENLMKSYNPAKARVSTYFLRYGPSHVRRMWLGEERRPTDKFDQSVGYWKRTGIRFEYDDSFGKHEDAPPADPSDVNEYMADLTDDQYHAIRCDVAGLRRGYAAKGMGTTGERARRIKDDGLDILAGVRGPTRAERKATP